MAKISASDVGKLRKTTGAGMMDCKKALTEADGDFDKAILIIRKRGQALANKRADREASEGVVIAKTNTDGTVGTVLAVNCETDFVAKNEDFVKFAYSILDLAIDNKISDIEALKQEKLGDKTVAEAIIEQIGVVGEKIELAYFDRIEAAQVVPYIHAGNKLATLVGLNAVADIEVGKDVAMQIAAMSPVGIDESDVDADIIAKEREIGREQAIKEGKPENIIDKIADGKVNKFFKENTLLNQTYTKDNKLSVRQYLQAANKELTVTAFKRYSLS